MAQDRGTALADREAALAAWRALPAQSRRRARQAAAKPEPIDDPELAAVVARYATAMRGQVPAGILVVALTALFGWLALAIFWITHGRTGFGVVLAAIGVVAAGLGIGALQVRQANYDRLYACAVTGPGAANRRRGRIGPLRGGKLAGLPEGQQPEQPDRAQATEMSGDRDAGHGEREDEVDDDDRQYGRGAQA